MTMLTVLETQDVIKEMRSEGYDVKKGCNNNMQLLIDLETYMSDNVEDNTKSDRILYAVNCVRNLLSKGVVSSIEL